MMNRHARILEDLGGYKRVASLFGMKENSVAKWRARGIPSQHWHRILAVAHDLTLEDLAHGKPRRQRVGRS